MAEREPSYAASAERYNREAKLGRRVVEILRDDVCLPQALRGGADEAGLKAIYRLARISEAARHFGLIEAVNGAARPEASLACDVCGDRIIGAEADGLPCAREDENERGAICSGHYRSRDSEPTPRHPKASSILLRAESETAGVGSAFKSGSERP